MKNSQKGFVTSLAVIFVLLLVVFICMFVYSKVEAPVVVNTPDVVNTVPSRTVSTNTDDSNVLSIAEIKDWKTYTNTQYGFELNYPPTYEIIKLEAEGVVYADSIGLKLKDEKEFDKIGRFDSVMQIILPLTYDTSAANPKATKLADYLNNYKSADVYGYDVIIHSSKSLVINGFSALKQVYSATREGDDLTTRLNQSRYVIFDGKSKFIIIDNVDGGDNSSLVNNIVSTFKFTK